MDSDDGVGIMYMSPQDNRVRRVVEPSIDLTDSAVVADPPE
jgi:hypothetical protein